MTPHIDPSQLNVLRRSSRGSKRALVAAVLALILGGATATAAAAPVSHDAHGPSGITVERGYHVQQLAAAASTTSSPDDIALLGGDVFIGYQNGVGTMGEPAPGGQTMSTIVEYTSNGRQLASWDVTGKCDGLGGDAATNEVLATVNEDGNSSMYAIHPATNHVVHLTYNVNPASLGGGGTDAVVVQNGTIYLSGSNPSLTSAPAVYTATLDEAAGTATLTTLFSDDSAAAGPGGPVTLALTDPDSNALVPDSVPGYGGDVVLVSQADLALIFVKDPGTSSQTLTELPIGAEIDDVRFVTTRVGMLVMTDNTTGTTYAITSHDFTPGTAYVATPSDSGVPGTLDELNLATGQLTPIAFGFTNPHGLEFLPGNGQGHRRP
jgi:hypothetical protein